MNPEQVTITIVSTPTEQKEAKIETSYTGLYRKVSNKHVISYEEAFAADGEAPMTSKNIIRFNQNMVHISKKGDVTSQMHFEKDSRHEGVYQTPFGTSQPRSIHTIFWSKKLHLGFASSCFILYI